MRSFPKVARLGGGMYASDDGVDEVTGGICCTEGDSIEVS